MTQQKTRKQFGLWPSPISSKRLSRGISFSDVAWDHDGTLVWRESRSGQGMLVVQPPDSSAPRDLNSDFAVSAGVGYGGGDFTVGYGNVYFVEKESKRIYRQPTHVGTARPITPAFGAAASPAISPNEKYLLYVHTYERKDSLAIVDTEGQSWPQKLVSGDDFYMQPCWHPDGERIAWIAWNHPQMPWDGTELQVAHLQVEGWQVSETTTIAGSEGTSIFQPQFSPDGRYLAYVSDESGWWQLYVYDLENDEHRQLTHEEAEHGIPAWVQGMRTYGFSSNGEKIFYTRIQEGFNSLWEVGVSSGGNKPIAIDDEYTWLDQIAVNPRQEQLAFIASGGSTPSRVVSFSVDEGTHIWRRSTSEDLPPSTYTSPEAITWQGMDGEDVHGLFYEPRSDQYEGIGSPPLITLIHGGPTSQRGASFYANVQFFTSRGYAVLQVNYRGSTGYGRAYRDKLRDSWGIYDVEDAVSGVRQLVAQNRADNDRLVIMGGSAGGFTVLKALEDYPGVFKAGVCMYGVTNQFTLVADTHKFEERYSDSLLGSLPEAAEIYRERSPIFFADKIQDPIIVFQGEEDKVVPKAQSDAIVDALRRNGVPHEYHLYPGEGHGFRKAETIEHFFNSVERFLKEYVIYS
ncbi:MAG: S9 family peptidase [Anaerolineales bacterium]|nr:S9 family peptidase [Chloroflexota bacterium]MBL6981034.1 S9 family peptidase [Anaerolineales bacterium]